jgi:hypothetical protein
MGFYKKHDKKIKFMCAGKGSAVRVSLGLGYFMTSLYGGCGEGSGSSGRKSGAGLFVLNLYPVFSL